MRRVPFIPHACEPGSHVGPSTNYTIHPLPPKNNTHTHTQRAQAANHHQPAYIDMCFFLAARICPARKSIDAPLRGVGRTSIARRRRRASCRRRGSWGCRLRHVGLPFVSRNRCFNSGVVFWRVVKRKTSWQVGKLRLQGSFANLGCKMGVSFLGFPVGKHQLRAERKL